MQIKKYNKFIKSKTHFGSSNGIKPIWLPDSMFDFQKYVAEHLIQKGRGAGFLDTGTGKTLIELVVAVNYIKATNKPVLIITPLAVAFQFIKEAEKFGIDDISYSKDGKYKTKIVICNYERLHLFNPTDFDKVILDESSILKNYDGAIKTQVTYFLKKMKYRSIYTATPSPNDFIELGTSSEALGYLGYTDMLGKYFTNNEDTIKPQNIGTKWILKGHAHDDFFKWVSTWSISMRKPSDLGFSNKGFNLPKLNVNHNFITNKKQKTNENGIPYLIFAPVAKSFSEVREEQKQTIEQRCERAVELANNYDTSVYWCNFNAEGDLLQSLDKTAKQIKGSMKLEEKEELLLAFSNGDIPKLITKAKMTAFGLNWQHCNHTVFFPTWSYEQYYQAIRRFWRFGQKKEVTCDMVLSDGQQRVLTSLSAKTEKANKLFTKLNTTLNSLDTTKQIKLEKKIKIPNFL
jgi:ERCC4-related helicase